TLPFVLLLIDFWPLERWRVSSVECRVSDHVSPVPPSMFNVRCSMFLRCLCEKLPFLALSAAACVLTILAQRQAHSVVSMASLPISNRIAHAIVAYLHYLSATFLPIHLAAYYPYETVLPAAKAI